MAEASFAEIIGQAIPTIQIMDVGAMPDGTDRYQPLLDAGLAEVTGFEPNPEQFALLQGRPGPYRYLPVFLGDGNPGTFHLTRFPGCASLLEPDPRYIDPFHSIGCSSPGGNFHVQRTASVSTTRLDDLGPEVTVDYLKIDVQGSELAIFQNGTSKLADTLVIESEVEFLPLYKDQPLFGDIQCFLRDQGFLLHRLVDVGGRALKPFQPPNAFLPISQILWADAIFVRDFTRLERYDDDDLLQAAAILDLVYGSIDLSALLLAEYDRRKDSALRDAYVRSLGSRSLKFGCVTIKDHP